MARLYGPLVYRWTRRAGLRTEEAADVVQEVFRTVVARLPEFHRDRVGDTFRGWMWAITRNKLGDHLRSKKRQPEATGGSQAMERLAQVPEPAELETGSSSDAREVGGLYQRAVALIRSEFEERTWEAFWRVTVDEQSPKQVAADLGMTVNAVYLAKARVLRRLREELGDAES